MGFNNTGYFWDEPEVLSCIVICDENEGAMSAVYQPTESELEDLCRKHSLDWDVLRSIINRRALNAHTFFIEVNKFRDHCQEVKDANSIGRT